MNVPENVVIIGAGPAGYTAAIYLSRAGFNPCLFEGKHPGGQLMETSYIENWPGEKKILGSALMSNMREHAIALGTRCIAQEITRLDCSQRPFKLTSHRNQDFSAHAIVIATGATPRRLGCPGESTLWGHGVSTCAVCDGAFYKNKRVVIVGGGDSAMEAASFLSAMTHDITVVHVLSSLTASYTMQQRVLKHPFITIIYESTVTEIHEKNKKLSGVTITHQVTGEKKELAADGVFITIGLTPNSHLVKGQVELDHAGYIVHKDGTQSSIPGIFAAGDIADFRYRQAITSASSGCMAALDVERYLHSL